MAREPRKTVLSLHFSVGAGERISQFRNPPFVFGIAV